ncbi:MAG: GspH/FimT family pseudopilin [Magnetococcales bacterium]|nr:GspH/FimT family pseudopilin [Magnetococcales bacterium]
MPSRNRTHRLVPGAKADGAAGFSLIEMVVVSAIVGIFIALAAPNLLSWMQDNTLAAQANVVIGAFNLARSESIKRGEAVTICSSVDGASCSGSLHWETGWILFDDPNNPGVRDAGESIIRVHEALALLTLRSTISRVTFSANGFSSGFAGTWTLCDSRGAATPPSATHPLGITLSNTGHVRSATGVLTCP